jgi:hypothetical protein
MDPLNFTTCLSFPLLFSVGPIGSINQKIG